MEMLIQFRKLLQVGKTIFVQIQESHHLIFILWTTVQIRCFGTSDSCLVSFFGAHNQCNTSYTDRLCICWNHSQRHVNLVNKYSRNFKIKTLFTLNNVCFSLNLLKLDI
jgi:hypothetical protein